MDKEVIEVRNLARHNKRNIMNKSIDIDCDGDEYSLIIRGVGAKTVKLELYVPYEDLLHEHDSKVIEGLLWDKINRVYDDLHCATIGEKLVSF